MSGETAVLIKAAAQDAPPKKPASTVIKAPPTASLEIGEEIRAAVDLDRIHLFDAGTESAVARR